MRTRPASRIKTLGDALDELVENFGIRQKLREQDVFEFWDKAVGERIAKVARPTRISKGTLFVSVQSGTWRNELSMRREEIVGRLNEIVNEEIVKDIKFQ
jgi:predicted nucleic acid-binding Zn ribbon protein